MTIIDVNIFSREIECIYKGERYSARDNGAVFRHQQSGKRLRPNDNKWTFGKKNSNNPYLHLSNARIHRIVATAFHGEPPDPQYVVDHIDTNCRNNRPENLRWVTRLENAIMNPVTRHKIEFLCGSIDAFLENPAILQTIQLEKNFEWMRTVTPAEARNCKERISIWASTNQESKGGGSLGEWIYRPIKNGVILRNDPAALEALAKQEAENGKARMYLSLKANPPSKKENTLDEFIYEPIKARQISVQEPDLVKALTKNCVQNMWRVPSYFPCCPEEIGTNPIEAYFLNLKAGAVFAYNDHYPESIILEFIMTKNNSSILIMC